MAVDAQVPPNDAEAEMGLIGSMLLDPEEIKHLDLVPEASDFYQSRHQAVWSIILSMTAAGIPCDILLVASEAEKRGLLEQIGGKAYLAEMGAAVTSPVHAKHYATIVRERSKSRSLQRIARNMLADIAESKDADGIHKQAQEALYGLSAAAGAKSAVHISEPMYQVLGALEGQAERGLVVTTGLTGLDELLAGGLHGGELSLVAGRASMGKTSFAMSCVLNAAQAGHGVLIFSLEMTAESVARNMLAAKASVTGERLRKGKDYIGLDGLDRIVDATKAINNQKIYISDACATDVADIRREVQRVQGKHGLGLVVVDYLQLLEGDNSGSRQEDVSRISRNLKILAKDTGLAVMALAQLNRLAEQREGHRPRMSDLRESGSLEQDADVVMLVYRPWYYSRLDSERNEAEVIVAKQRHGATETVRLRFLPEFLLFTDPVRE